MTNTELEELIMSTDFTDDIERNLFLMDIAAHDQEMDEAMYKKPSWWYIGMGLQEAPEQVKFKAREIYLEFFRFKPPRDVTGFQDRVELFTLAKIQNKIRS